MRRFPKTFWLGLIVIVALEALLFYDVFTSHRGIVRSDYEVSVVFISRPPATRFGKFARLIAINITALAWPAYILLLEGMLTKQRGRSPVRARKHHFALLCLASVFIWCIFDAVNFRGGMRAWEYIGIPHVFWDRVAGYLLAFACVVPSMLMSGQVLLNLGIFNRMRGNPRNLPMWGWWLIL